MSLRRLPGLLRLPLISPLLRRTSNSRDIHDDDRALLEDDALSIPLESYESATDSASGQLGIASIKRRYSGSRWNRTCQLAIFITIFAGLILAILLPRPRSSSHVKKGGLLPCGNSRYSINDVSIRHTGEQSVSNSTSTRVTVTLSSARSLIRSVPCHAVTVVTFLKNTRKIHSFRHIL